MNDEELFHGAAPATHQPGAGMFGTGFALRLAAAEARAAGGSIMREHEQLLLTLPGLTLPIVNLSQVPENRSEACETPVA